MFGELAVLRHPQVTTGKSKLEDMMVFGEKPILVDITCPMAGGRTGAS